MPSGRIKILQKFARCVKLFEPEKNGRAGVAELADALDLGSNAIRRGSSSLFARTNCYYAVVAQW